MRHLATMDTPGPVDYRRPMRRAALTVMALLGLAAAPSPALAIVTVESDGTNGLRVTDATQAKDIVVLSLVTTSTGLEWRIKRTSPQIELSRFDIRPGCKLIDDSNAACTRLNGQVTVTLLGENDNFAVGGLTPITDRLQLNGGTGDDTIVGGAGPDTITGGSDNDVLSGGAGADTLRAGPGNDILNGDTGNDSLFGEDGNDRLNPFTGEDTAEGGSGDDTFDLGTTERDERDTINGGIGRDSAGYGVPGRVTPIRLIEANLETIAGEKDTSEQDVLRSVERYAGGVSGDILTGVLSSNDSDFDGGRGDDVVFGGSGPNTVTGGAGADELDGNAGTDIVDGKSGEGATAVADPKIDCGDGTDDLAILDLKDDLTPTGCENLNRSPAGEGPHVRITVPRQLAAGGKRTSLRLHCPKALTKPCAGTLAIGARGRTSPRTRYTIKRGKSKLVRVELGSARVTRRTVGTIVSLEQGLKGLKTTTRRVILRG